MRSKSGFWKWLWNLIISLLRSLYSLKGLKNLLQSELGAFLEFLFGIMLAVQCLGWGLYATIFHQVIVRGTITGVLGLFFLLISMHGWYRLDLKDPFKKLEITS